MNIKKMNSLKIIENTLIGYKNTKINNTKIKNALTLFAKRLVSFLKG